MVYLFSQAGGMERARALPKIKDADKESLFGYVYAVSGPGELVIFLMQGSHRLKKTSLIPYPGFTQA